MNDSALYRRGQESAYRSMDLYWRHLIGGALPDGAVRVQKLCGAPCTQAEFPSRIGKLMFPAQAPEISIQKR